MKGALPKRWVKFTLSPIVGCGDDGARAVPHHDGLVRRRSLLLPKKRPPSALSQTKPISDEQMEVRIVLGALIALLVVSAIVVWIYASRT
jgi:hypothetical protein